MRPDGRGGAARADRGGHRKAAAHRHPGTGLRVRHAAADPGAAAARARRVRPVGVRGRSFQAVVSNLPGLDATVTLAGAPVLAAHPIVPTAKGAPLAVGALGWNGELDFGVSVDPALVADAGTLCRAMTDVLRELSSGGTGTRTPAHVA
ncbi:WS/DGAT domain-containing protein [Actinomadura keratinilytica]|uniref:WS/DGAT domain-containing protein n=1 Tax=Actinomadura keratinilytica TaxID=547461 RepID=UPI003616E268